MHQSDFWGPRAYFYGDDLHIGPYLLSLDDIPNIPIDEWEEDCKCGQPWDYEYNDVILNVNYGSYFNGEYTVYHWDLIRRCPKCDKLSRDQDST